MNYADCQLVTDAEGFSCIVAVTSGQPDNMTGCHYTLHLPNGEIVGSGFSKGFQETGAGAALTAMENGKKAAKRYLSAQAKARKIRNSTPVEIEGDLIFKKVVEPKCKHCGREKGKHQAKTGNCPVGRGNFPTFDRHHVFEDRATRQKKCNN